MFLSDISQAEEAHAATLTIYFDDSHGKFYPESDWVRENLLQTALHDALRSNKAFEIGKIEYNREIPEIVTDSIEIHILEWRRNHSGFYSFRGSADYYDLQGEKHSLGIIEDTRSGINVFNNFDVRDTFIEVAESAFRRTFRKIEKL